MAQFPRTEANTAALAESIIAGLLANPIVYPVPPVESEELQTLLEEYYAAHNAAVEAAANASQATTTKKEVLKRLEDGMKADLRYAENTVRGEDDHLKLLGWGGRRAKKWLQSPGQCLELEAPREGKGWIELTWKSPADGGAVAAYEIERRALSDGTWQNAAVAMKNEFILTEQQRGVEWEYRVMAVNKVGTGGPSNTIMAVL